MKKVTSLEEWKAVYKRGHVVFVLNYIKVFVRDYIFLAAVLLLLIKFGIIKAYGTSIMIGQGICFVLLGLGLGELQWYLYKRAFGVPDDL